MKKCFLKRWFFYIFECFFIFAFNFYLGFKGAEIMPVVIMNFTFVLLAIFIDPIIDRTTNSFYCGQNKKESFKINAPLFFIGILGFLLGWVIQWI